jgi:S-adenosylmethionine decarboxylase
MLRLYTMDALVADPAVLVAHGELRTLLYDAATAGGARVLADAFHVFPNGAVTGALLLAQSHLSIHTWPEGLLANVDLLSCGPVDGEHVLQLIRDGLGAERAEIGCMPRGATG